MSYNSIIERVFLARYRPGDTLVEFIREDLVDAATALGVPVPRNLGDVLYTFRYRRPLPKAILKTAPNEKEWSISQPRADDNQDYAAGPAPRKRRG